MSRFGFSFRGGDRADPSPPPTSGSRVPNFSCRILRAAEMIEMAVADDRVLDRRGIEAELLQPADDFVLDRIVEDRVDEDDPVATSLTAHAEYSVLPT